MQCLWMAGKSSLLLSTVKAEVDLVGGKAFEEEGKCRKMGVSDGLGPEMVLLGAEAMFAPGPDWGTGLHCQSAQISLPAFHVLLRACENPVKCHTNPTPNFPPPG